MIGPPMGELIDKPVYRDVDRLFGAQRQRDLVGLRIHVACAAIACFGAGLPTSFCEWSAVPVYAACLIRLTGHIHVPGPLLKDWSVRLLMTLAAYMLISRGWTAGPNDWWRDIQGLRFAPLVLAIYPVLESRRTLIGALVAGLVVGQGVQVLDALGHVAGIGWLDWRRAAGRHSGWWDPAVAGSLLTAALGVHVGAAACGRGCRRARVWGVIGAAITLGCIVLSGTRGAWIAGTVVVAIGVGLAAWRSADRIRTLAIGALGCAVVGGLMGAVVWSGVLGARERLERGVSEVRRAIESRDYASDTGMRVAMAKWAIAECMEKPWVGVGAGGYQAWARTELEKGRPGPRPAQPEPPEAGPLPLPLPLPPAHAHNWYLHTLATLGVIGAALMFGLTIVSVGCGGAWRGAQERGYDAGPAMGLVGLLAVGVFDTIHVNQQTAFMMFLLVAMCVSVRPRLAIRTRAEEGAGTGEGEAVAAGGECGLAGEGAPPAGARGLVEARRCA